MVKSRVSIYIYVMVGSLIQKEIGFINHQQLSKHYYEETVILSNHSKLQQKI